MDMTISLGNILTVAAMVISMAVTWGVIRTQVAPNAKKIETLEKLQADSEKCQTQLDVRLARIEVDIQWIRHALGGKPRGE